ncbi:hypothetical protein fh0823_28050 (plasmid) [Francisella halioticida]|uniref:replication initiation protein n=1 Tax=Francisella halioticida TaxID=549298 RepID=UPI001AF6ADFA|nr:replication initiation protein [Francisella halioticida]BCD92668.1 hypothetical protein fh0823_28050 [Francisella halioticida]
MGNIIREVFAKQAKIRCSDRKDYSIIRNLNQGLDKLYIEINPLNSYEWIVIDCDHDVPYYKDMLVYPNYIVKNPGNNKAHLFFKVSAVHRNENSSYKAQEYYHSVRIGLTILLKGDMGFSQVLCKNPLIDDFWRVEHLHDKEYELSELADYCDFLPKNLSKAKNLEELGLGRNCEIFEKVRHQAYKLPVNENLFDKVYYLCQQENLLFTTPLFDKEVKHIAKSITKYVSSRDNKHWYQKLVERQKERGKKSGQKRAEKSELLQGKIIPLLYTNKTLQAIADFIGTSLSTVKRVKLVFKQSLIAAKNAVAHEPYQVVPACGADRGKNLNFHLSDESVEILDNKIKKKEPYICNSTRHYSNDDDT